ncbi:MAG: hypothetical protein QOI61_1473 [Actinomycetota bacterium]
MRFLRRAILRAFVTALAATSLTSCRTDAPPPPTETLDELVTRLVPQQPGGELGFGDEPTSYRVDYDLYVRGHTKGDTAGEGARRRSLLDATPVVRNVIRPFNATGTSRRSLGFVREVGGGDSRVGLVRPLPDDPRPHVYPPTSPPLFRRKIAGRLCAAYQFGKDEYCIDSNGIVLLTRSANSVELVTKVTLGNETKSAAELALPLAKGLANPDRGSIRPIHPETAPAGATDYSLDAPPGGFVFVGRYSVVPLTPEVLKRTSRKIFGGIVDVYVRNADAVIVERGGKLDLSDVGPEDLGSLIDAHDVDLGLLGTGQAGIGGTGPFGYREVRAAPAQGRYVVVAGTLPEAELVTVARSLRAWPGNEMVFLDG